MGCGGSKETQVRRRPPPAKTTVTETPAGPPPPSRLAALPTAPRPSGAPPVQLNIVETAPVVEDRTGDSHVWAWWENVERIPDHKFRTFSVDQKGGFVAYPPSVSRQIETLAAGGAMGALDIDITYKLHAADSGRQYSVLLTSRDAGTQRNKRTRYARDVKRFAI